MSRKLELINTKFGKDEDCFVIEETNLREGKSIVYRCKCGKCGDENWKLSARRIVHDDPISCGCLNNKSESTTVHGFTKNRKKDKFYSIWCDMKARTSDLYKSKELNDTNGCYITKDIKCCTSWEEFENFKNDMYELYLLACSKYGEENISIDRIDPNGDYEPSNCRWANPTMQLYNRDFTKHSRTKPILATRIEDDYKIITYNAKVFSRMIFNTPNHHITDVCKGKRPMEKGWKFEIITDEVYFKMKEDGLDFIESIYIYKLNIPHVVIQEDVSTNIHESQEDYLKSVVHYYINQDNKIVYGSKSKIHKELGFHSKSSMDFNLYNAPNKRVRKLTDSEITLHLQGHQIQF